MLAEVSSGYVDASIGGFSTSLERFQLVEFSQSLASSRLSIITKTPEKSDQVSYITRSKTRFTKNLVVELMRSILLRFYKKIMAVNFHHDINTDFATHVDILFLEILQC